jgi:hypothetical protein
LDIILRNADYGSKAKVFPPLKIYLNHERKKSSVVLDLETNKHGVAYGAIVNAQIGNSKVLRHLIVNNGAAQSEPLIHIGLDGASKIDKLEILWTSGEKAILENISPGRYKIIEKGNLIRRVTFDLPSR